MAQSRAQCDIAILATSRERFSGLPIKHRSKSEATDQYHLLTLDSHCVQPAGAEVVSAWQPAIDNPYHSKRTDSLFLVPSTCLPGGTMELIK